MTYQVTYFTAKRDFFQFRTTCTRQLTIGHNMCLSCTTFHPLAIRMKYITLIKDVYYEYLAQSSVQLHGLIISAELYVELITVAHFCSDKMNNSEM